MIEAKAVVSYTTRPIRDNETDGVEHYFITNTEANEIMEDNQGKLLAYTCIGDNEYFVTYDKYVDEKFNLYIINPDAAEDLIYNFPDINVIRVYIHTDKILRAMRTADRSDHDVFDDRNRSESDEFMRCEMEESFDYIIDNSGTLEKSIDEFVKIYKEETEIDPNTLFCIMGRTGSGKDSIMNGAIKVINGGE